MHASALALSTSHSVACRANRASTPTPTPPSSPAVSPRDVNVSSQGDMQEGQQGGSQKGQQGDLQEGPGQRPMCRRRTWSPDTIPAAMSTRMGESDTARDDFRRDATGHSTQRRSLHRGSMECIRMSVVIALRGRSKGVQGEVQGEFCDCTLRGEVQGEVQGEALKGILDSKGMLWSKGRL